MVAEPLGLYCGYCGSAMVLLLHSYDASDY